MCFSSSSSSGLHAEGKSTLKLKLCVSLGGNSDISSVFHKMYAEKMTKETQQISADEEKRLGSKKYRHGRSDL